MLSALWPTAVAQSSWAFGTAAFRKSFIDIAGVLGYEIKNSPTQVPVRPEVQIQKAEREKDPALPPPVKQQTPDGSSSSSTASNEAGRDTTGDTKRNAQDAAGATDLVKDIAQDQVKTFKELWEAPRAAFNTALRKYWQKPRPFPPRGCIMVSGFVELESHSAYIMLDVVAFWNPKTRKYDTPSMRVALRRVQQKLQRPVR
jgi:hypothetical protein